MLVADAALLSWLSAPASDMAKVEAALVVALPLVTKCAGSDFDTIPSDVFDHAVKVCCAEIYNQRKAPNGITQFADMQGTGIRVARDPLVGVRPLFAEYRAGGFA